MNYSVELTKVDKRYPGVQALKNINFRLRAGEVHCLVGENGSGKSTLIKIISGVEQPELGAEILVEGVQYSEYNCEVALTQGIQVIYQDISLFPNLTIKENIAFRHYTNDKNHLVDWKNIENIAKGVLDELDLDLDLDRKVGTLSISQQQLVEIGRSLTGKTKLLILDEPTASLTRKEVNSLFRVIEKLKAKNIAILFVSHKLNEIFDIAENITVIRDGSIVGSYPPTELDYNKLTYLMTGEYEHSAIPKALEKHTPSVLRVENLSKKDNYKDISLEVFKGEILGITGLLGSGRTELALSLFGMLQADSGAIYLEGKKITLKSHVAAKEYGIAYVPENRRDDGLVQEQSIGDNISLTTLGEYLNKYRLIDEKKRRDFIASKIIDFGVKAGKDIDSAVQTLSGGNQQKIVLAKWIATHPKLLILDEPTVGIDIIAKTNIYQLIKKLAEEGVSIILISDELQEVVNNCHRVLVMEHGKLVYEFNTEETNSQYLLETFNLS